jgi:hypothetical protein
MANALRLNEQSLAGYRADCFSGAQISLYIGGIWVEDAVSIQYTLSDPKSPVYGYNSRYYDMVAFGNRVVQGQIAIAYTEEGYLSSILYAHKKMMGELDGEEDEGYSGTFLATNKTDKAATWTTQDEWGSRAIVSIKAKAKALEQQIATNPPPDNVVDLKKDLERYNRQIADMEKISNGKSMPTLYTRQNIQGFLGDLRGVSSYEDFVELIEDALVDADKMAALSKRYPWLVIRGNNGNKIRRGTEFDVVEGITQKNKVPYLYPGSGFDIIIAYGDMSIGSAEHTMKTITDVHLTTETQVVEANGNPVLEIYTFFAKDVDDLSTMARSRSKGYSGQTESGYGTGAPSPDENVTEFDVFVNALSSKGVATTEVAHHRFPVSGEEVQVGVQSGDDVRMTSSTQSADLSQPADSGFVSSVYQLDAAITVAEYQKANAYQYAVSDFRSIVPNILVAPVGYTKTLVLRTKNGSEKIVLTETVGTGSARDNMYDVDGVAAIIVAIAEDALEHKVAILDWKHGTKQPSTGKSLAVTIDQIPVDELTYVAYTGVAYTESAKSSVTTNSYQGSKAYKNIKEYIDFVKTYLGIHAEHKLTYASAYVYLVVTKPNIGHEAMKVEEL